MYGDGEMHHVQALIDWGEKSIYVTLRLRKWLAVTNTPAHFTTLGRDSQVVAPTSDRRKIVFTV